MYKYNNCNFPINISCCGQPLYAGSRKIAVSQYTRACGQRNMKVFYNFCNTIALYIHCKIQYTAF